MREVHGGVCNPPTAGIEGKNTAHAGGIVLVLLRPRVFLLGFEDENDDDEDDQDEKPARGGPRRFGVEGLL
jgi:hypothetical protein